ncbi:hypothetical protein PCAR4_830025 [Paraburkholderia caribensis]|nr:hypothetical protein PCAR4_830025 [Paraburkholderia caribensis]
MNPIFLKKCAFVKRVYLPGHLMTISYFL